MPFTKTDIQGFIDCINDGKPLPALPVTMITPEGVDPFPLRPGLLDLLAAVTCCIWSEKYGDTSVPIDRLVGRIGDVIDDLHDDLEEASWINRPG